MLGLSGGLDSSYAAYIGYTYGLRMLAVHIDDGLDAPVTTKNVKQTTQNPIFQNLYGPATDPAPKP